MAMGDLQLDSNSLINSGSIIANNVDITTANNITNNNISEIIANNDLNLTSNNGSIINFSKLKAIAAISLSAQNIINTSTVKTNAANLLNLDNPAYINNQASNSNNISSTLFETATITSASLNANAEIDFNNYAANITTTSGDLNIIAGDDINITSLALRNRDEFRSKKYTKITDITTNTSSNIDINNNLILISGNDTNIKGSNIVATRNADIKIGGELNITSAQDSYYKYIATKKKKSFGRSKSSTSLTETKTQIASNIVVGGDIMLDGVSDVNILGSNIRGENGQIISQAGNVNIKNGINSVKSYTTSKKKGSTAKSSSKIYDYQETAAESNLAFNNDLKVNAELGDVNIQGSTLNVNNDLSFGSFTIAQNSDGSLKIKADGTFETVSGDVVQNVNIRAAELKSEHFEEHKLTSFNPITAAMAAVAEVASLGGLIPALDKLNEKLQERVNDMVGSGNEAVIEKLKIKAQNQK